MVIVTRNNLIKTVASMMELDPSKLPNLLTLKYDSPNDAVNVVGEVLKIRQMFVGFQKSLYAKPRAA